MSSQVSSPLSSSNPNSPEKCHDRSSNKRGIPDDSDFGSDGEVSSQESETYSEEEVENKPVVKKLIKPRPRPKVLTAAQRDAMNGVSMIKDRDYKPVAQTSAHRKFDPTGHLVKRFKIPTFTDGRVVESSLPPVLGMLRRINLLSRGLHDPEADGAIVLYEPKQLSAQEQLDALKSTAMKGDDATVKEVHVVVDPMLSRVLRPHQIEGVRFLWDCTTGRKAEGMYGCIMADEMGLGKTLQCIALLWTLLRQSPIPSKTTIDKAIIVCPSSLVRNWAKEIDKWLKGRVNCLVCDGKESKADLTKSLKQYVAARGRGIINPVLIISYESLRIYSKILGTSEIGLMLCDEGHRLKNQDNQTYVALNGLNTKRRVILSGTPIQNDLTEYFSLLNFSCPGSLGTTAEFRKNFERPILRGRDVDATDKDKQLSEEKLKELLEVANKFIIRRTAELLTKYLPIKYEHVVFVKMLPIQVEIYKKIMQSKAVKNMLNGNAGTQPLKMVTMLKKLCNHPALLDEKDLEEVSDLLPPGFSTKTCQPHMSSKFTLLDRMITSMKRSGDDKIVIISNYTQTLDLVEKLCQDRGWGRVRLDGSMVPTKRQKLVDRFNDLENKQEFIFLLSSKAGGCGINLIGANRLILMDPDWNPANDAQALARVWREGQKKTCYIYRFIATGTLEEKIFQRQAHKQSLSSCVVDEEEDVERHFSLDNLRQLFQLNEETMSDTHDAFRCKRCFRGHQVQRPPEREISAGASAADTSQWNHISQLEIARLPDNLLRDCSGNLLSYVFQNKSHEVLVTKVQQD